MQPHIRNYLQSRGYDESDVILCEVCGDVAVDIHHIVPRSKFGSKRKKEQDDPSNLIGVCRVCHDKAHSGELTKEYLRLLVNLY